MRKILLALLILFSFINIAEAKVTIKEIDNIPKYFPFENYKIKTIKDTKIIPKKEWIMEEVNYIENQLPSLKKIDYTIYIVNKQIKMPNYFLAGLAYSTNKIYLFSYKNVCKREVRYITAHEIGHLVHYNNFKKEELKKYQKNRKKINKVEEMYDTPEELFAEDFRYLFGSKDANFEGTRSNYTKPTKKEKTWIYVRVEKLLKKFKIYNILLEVYNENFYRHG